MPRDPYPTDRPAVVTCGLPYANGDLHIGHMRTYVSGDVLARSLRLVGQRTAFVCGSDMHGTPVAVNAEKEGVSPEEFAMRWHAKYEETFPKLDIEFDNYGHTHDETNREMTHRFVRSWIDNGHVFEKEIQVAWDPAVDQPLPDRYVEGTCPYCGEKARGDECDEGCQRHLEPGEIEDPRSTLTGNPAEYRTRAHKFLRLADFQEYLNEFLDRLEGTSNARNQPREWIEGELKDLCITRDMDWGIDYPGEGSEDLVLYVWVDAPIEYVSSTKQYSDRVGPDTYDWESVWREGGEIIHIIGRDIIQHHCVFWPAMLRGAEFAEPRAVMASGFVNLDGRAFSTSRNRAVWVDDYLETGFKADFLRYYLVTAGGFQQDVDFSWSRFQEVVNGELVGTLGNFVYRALLFANRNYGGTPEESLDPEVADRIEAATAALAEAVNDYRLKAVGEVGMELARFGNEYIQRNEPWNLLDEEPAEAASVIRNCVQLVKAIAIVVSPVMPETAEEIWAQLDEGGSVHAAGMPAATAAPPADFGEPEELIEQIDDDRIASLEVELAERIEAATGDGSGDKDGDKDEDRASDGDGDDAMADRSGNDEPIESTTVPFETFAELDIRVGRIESASPIEGADELVRLTVDIGPERRQMVAGLKPFHEVDRLPGRKVIVLANLEPREIFGVESQGMVLAAGDEADLLTTHGDAAPGTRIR